MKRTDSVPNFFILGAMKCGTTTLHNLLGEHPDVFMTKVKEPAFFALRNPTTSERRTYAALFDQVGDERVIGESSTQYSMLPTYSGCVERIAAASPHAKFVYVMRDPVQRTISHYWHQYRSKQSSGGDVRPMEVAVAEDAHYHTVSDYSAQLLPYFERFGRSNVMPIVLEEFTKDPAETYRKILEFLGVDSSFEPGDVERRDHDGNRVTARKRRWLARLQKSDAWDSFRAFIPSSVRQIGYRLIEYDHVDRKQFCDIAARRALLPFADRWVADTERLLDRDLSVWRDQWELFAGGAAEHQPVH